MIFIFFLMIRRPPRSTRTDTLFPYTTLFRSIGKPLPRVEDSVRIGELLRRAVMSEAKRQLGENAIPSVLSGHGLDMDGKHRHAFFLPWDGSRSEERRVGKECVSACRSRWSPYH